MSGARGRGVARPALRPFAAVLLSLILAALIAETGGALAQEAESSASASPGDSTESSIEFPHLPILIVKPIPTIGSAPLTVGFLVTNANPQSAPFISYRWTFGDGKISTLPPTLFFHTYVNPGSYVIEVTGTTADGHTATGFGGVVVRR